MVDASETSRIAKELLALSQAAARASASHRATEIDLAAKNLDLKALRKELEEAKENEVAARRRELCAQQELVALRLDAATLRAHAQALLDGLNREGNNNAPSRQALRAQCTSASVASLVSRLDLLQAAERGDVALLKSALTPPALPAAAAAAAAAATATSKKKKKTGPARLSALLSIALERTCSSSSSSTTGDEDDETASRVASATFLLDQGAALLPVNRRKKTSCLHGAVSRRRASLVTLLLSHAKADAVTLELLDAVDAQGRTPLHVAAKLKLADITASLLEAGADTCRPVLLRDGTRGRTAPSLAMDTNVSVPWGDVETMRRLFTSPLRRFWNRGRRAALLYQSGQFQLASTSYAGALRLREAAWRRGAVGSSDIARLYYNHARACARAAEACARPSKYGEVRRSCDCALEWLVLDKKMGSFETQASAALLAETRRSISAKVRATRARAHFQQLDFDAALVDIQAALVGGRWSSVKEELRAEWEALKRESERCRDASHYAVLGLPEDTVLIATSSPSPALLSGGDVKRAFRRASIKWHPDKLVVAELEREAREEKEAQAQALQAQAQALQAQAQQQQQQQADDADSSSSSSSGQHHLDWGNLTEPLPLQVAHEVALHSACPTHRGRQRQDWKVEGTSQGTTSSSQHRRSDDKAAAAQMAREHFHRRATNHFRRINLARKVLADDLSRRAYDKRRRYLAFLETCDRDRDRKRGKKSATTTTTTTTTWPWSKTAKEEAAEAEREQARQARRETEAAEAEAAKRTLAAADEVEFSNVLNATDGDDSDSSDDAFWDAQVAAKLGGTEGEAVGGKDAPGPVAFDDPFDEDNVEEESKRRSDTHEKETAAGADAGAAGAEAATATGRPSSTSSWRQSSIATDGARRRAEAAERVKAAALERDRLQQELASLRAKAESRRAWVADQLKHVAQQAEATTREASRIAQRRAAATSTSTATRSPSAAGSSDDDDDDRSLGDVTRGKGASEPSAATTTKPVRPPVPPPPLPRGRANLDGKGKGAALEAAAAAANSAAALERLAAMARAQTAAIRAQTAAMKHAAGDKEENDEARAASTPTTDTKTSNKESRGNADEKKTEPGASAKLASAREAAEKEAASNREAAARAERASAAARMDAKSADDDLKLFLSRMRAKAADRATSRKHWHSSSSPAASASSLVGGEGSSSSSSGGGGSGSDGDIKAAANGDEGEKDVNVTSSSPTPTPRRQDDTQRLFWFRQRFGADVEPPSPPSSAEQAQAQAQRPDSSSEASSSTERADYTDEDEEDEDDEEDSDESYLSESDSRPNPVHHRWPQHQRRRSVRL